MTKRICLGLQLRDWETVLNGRETGVLVRLPNGGVVELLEPVPEPEAQLLGSYECPRAMDIRPNRRSARRTSAKQLQARLSQIYFEECLPFPGQFLAGCPAEHEKSPDPGMPARG